MLTMNSLETRKPLTKLPTKMKKIKIKEISQTENSVSDSEIQLSIYFK